MTILAFISPLSGTSIFETRNLEGIFRTFDDNYGPERTKLQFCVWLCMAVASNRTVVSSCLGAAERTKFSSFYKYKLAVNGISKLVGFRCGLFILSMAHSV